MSAHITQGVSAVGSNSTLMSPGMAGGISPSSASAAAVTLLEPGGASPQQHLVGCPNSVLRIIIENMLYPITIDVLHQVRECTVLVGLEPFRHTFSFRIRVGGTVHVLVNKKFMSDHCLTVRANGILTPFQFRSITVSVPFYSVLRVLYQDLLFPVCTHGIAIAFGNVKLIWASLPKIGYAVDNVLLASESYSSRS